MRWNHLRRGRTATFPRGPDIIAGLAFRYGSVLLPNSYPWNAQVRVIIRSRSAVRSLPLPLGPLPNEIA